MGYQLAGRLSRPDAGHASPALEWHWLMHQGIFPAVSRTTPAWISPVNVMDRHLHSMYFTHDFTQVNAADPRQDFLSGSGGEAGRS